MTICEPPASPDLHPALTGRFSPVGFDPSVDVSNEQIDTLLDAARHAPSAGNSQPWRFVVGRRGSDIHGRIVRHLARSSSQWAPSASVIFVNLAHTTIEGTDDWEYSEFSRYDLGQAVAHMTIQGLHLGLDAHQFRAFDRHGIAGEFGIPTHWEATSMTAFGVSTHRAGEVMSAGTSRDRAGRTDITWARG